VGGSGGAGGGAQSALKEDFGEQIGVKNDGRPPSHF